MLSPAKPLVAFNSPASLCRLLWVSHQIWDWTKTGANLNSRSQISSQEVLSLLALPPPRTRTLLDHQYMICYDILTLDVVWTAVLCKAATLYALWNTTHLGSKVTTKELWLGWGREALKMLPYAAPCSTFNHSGDSFAGKFREKASILHKIAKKKCQVEDSEKANGVASRSGEKLFHVSLDKSIVCDFVCKHFLAESYLRRLIPLTCLCTKYEATTCSQLT